MTVTDHEEEASLEAKTPNTASIQVEMSGGDNLLGVNEDAVLTVTVLVSNDKDPGRLSILLDNLLVRATPSNRVLIGAPSPVPPSRC